MAELCMNVAILIIFASYRGRTEPSLSFAVRIAESETNFAR